MPSRYQAPWHFTVDADHPRVLQHLPSRRAHSASVPLLKPLVECDVYNGAQRSRDLADDDTATRWTCYA
jgi:hypothetical protein